MKYLGTGLVIASIVLGGCSSTYQRDDLTPSSAKLATGASVLIATPANGSYDGKEYTSSGTSTALAVRSAFARHSSKVSVSSSCRDLECLRAADGAADYHVVPEILHWEDRATEWSGKKDKIEVKIAVFDGKTGKELSSSVIAGKSKWATFGGDHPQDLLPEPITGYVQTLY